MLPTQLAVVTPGQPVCRYPALQTPPQTKKQICLLCHEDPSKTLSVWHAFQHSNEERSGLGVILYANLLYRTSSIIYQPATRALRMRGGKAFRNTASPATNALQRCLFNIIIAVSAAWGSSVLAIAVETSVVASLDCSYRLLLKYQKFVSGDHLEEAVAVPVAVSLALVFGARYCNPCLAAWDSRHKQLGGVAAEPAGPEHIHRSCYCRRAKHRAAGLASSSC